jgi:hypothetical protein
MTKILVDLSDEEDQTVEIYKAEHRLETKEEAVKEIVAAYKKSKK